jgi:hypothetical protein
MNCQKIISAVLVLVSLTIHTDCVEGSWWDKGVSIFDSLTKDTSLDKPSRSDIGDAFKEALRIGSENVVKQLGQFDGFNADPKIHIPLPEELATVKTVLGKIGMSSIVEDLELKLNRAAEVATPKAKKLFWQAITEMTFDDVMNIYEGPDDSATQYFRDKMSPGLKKEMQPLVENSMSQVGAVQAYDTVIGQYSSLPFVPDVKADLTEYVLQKGIDGIFYYIAKEEAAIRRDPVKQTTELLKRVFGAQ